MTTLSLAAVSAATCVNALVAAAILFRRGQKPVNFARLAVAAFVVCVLALIEGAIALKVVHSYFMVVAIAYANLMVLVPWTGVALLVAARRRPVTRVVQIAASLSLGIVPIFVVATFIEPYRLVTEATTVPIVPGRGLSRPLVVGILADIQCVEVTDRERDAVARIMAARPDLIFVPGDLQQAGFDHAGEIGPQLRALFAPLSAPLGVWYVEGNTETIDEARRLLAGTGVRFLHNEIVRLEVEGARVALCGVDLMFQSGRARAALREIEADVGTDEVRIVLAHRPDVVDELRRGTRVDLVIAGHTHGGQVQLPWIGPLITLSNVPRRVAAGGLHDLDGRRIYVSRGIGWEHGHAPRVRFLCPPEVSLLTLRPEPRE